MEHLLLLHGALGAAPQLEALKTVLSDRFTVHTLDFEGHGGRPAGGPFTIERFAQNVLDFLDEQAVERVTIFGYSMGGYVALKLAVRHPERIARIVTLGTKFAWSPEIAAKETALLNREKIKEKVPKFAAALAQLHAPLDWTEVMHETAELMRGLGNEPALTDADLRSIQLPVTLLLGSEDTMVTREETEHAKDQLPNAVFQIIDDWQHPIERVNVEELGKRIAELL